MGKFFKILAGIILLLFVAVVVGGYIFIKTFNFNDYKDDVTELVSEKLGRKLVINGDAYVGLSLFPTIIVEDVELAKKLGEDFLYRTTMQTNLVDGAIEILDYLKGKGYILSIISNGFVEVQYTKLRRSGLLPYFSNVFLSEEIGCQKPNIRFFQAVLEKLQAKPAECLVIGDNLQTDIQGAQNANINSIFFANGSEFSENSGQFMVIIQNLMQLKKLL